MKIPQPLNAVLVLILFLLLVSWIGATSVRQGEALDAGAPVSSALPSEAEQAALTLSPDKVVDD